MDQGLLALLLAAGLSGPGSGISDQAAALRTGLQGTPQALCQSVVDGAAAVTDQDALHDCIHFYWHNGEHDIGWNRIIRLYRRLIELEPAEPQNYGDCAWLLWSKWVRWSQDPGSMPDGAGKKEESIALFERGRAANLGSAAFLAAYASHMDAFLKEYPRAIELWKETESLAAAPKTRIRARMSLGNDYRKSGQAAEAIRWYRAVLELDPDNRGARNYLRQLED